jgi:hypothetical protein
MYDESSRECKMDCSVEVAGEGKGVLNAVIVEFWCDVGGQCPPAVGKTPWDPAKIY